MDGIGSIAAEAAAALGRGLAGVEPLSGQASARRYVRLRLDRGLPGGETSMMLVLLGDNPLGAEEVTSEGQAAELPFSAMQRFLAGRGVPVPALLVDRWQEGWQVQEDLGATTLKASLEGLEASDRMARLREGVDLLVDFQRRVWSAAPGACPTPAGRFDHALLRWELDHFVEWGLRAGLGARPDADEQGAWDRCLDRVAAALARRADRVAHRDYQSTNLMVTPRGLVLIDFQDALLGTEAYDLVAYLRDSYVELAPAELEALLRRYEAGREAAGIPVAGDFRALFDLQTVQRKLKDAGRFVFLDRVKGKPGYLPYVAPSLRYVMAALDRLPEHGELRSLLARQVPPG